MKHRYPVKVIAQQAGVGTATVDRVLNGRPGVKRQTINRVLNAIRELESQEMQLAMSGRKLMLDLIVEAPNAFRDALDLAVTRELPLIQSAIFRVRRDMRRRFPQEAIIDALERAGKISSDGVILMAPDAPGIRTAVDKLSSAGVPVITLASDMESTARVSYVGLNNRVAGATAAWLVRRWLPLTDPPRVLVTQRNETFLGEHEREMGFRERMKALCPDADIHLLVQGMEGPEFSARVADAGVERRINALYSIGGGNQAISRALDEAGIRPGVFLAHDLDPENRALLARERLDAVLYHDLAEDFRNACRAIIAARTNRPLAEPEGPSTLRIMLPTMVDETAGPLRAGIPQS